MFKKTKQATVGDLNDTRIIIFDDFDLITEIEQEILQVRKISIEWSSINFTNLIFSL